MMGGSVPFRKEMVLARWFFRLFFMVLMVQVLNPDHQCTDSGKENSQSPSESVHLNHGQTPEVKPDRQGPMMWPDQRRQ